MWGVNDDSHETIFFFFEFNEGNGHMEAIILSGYCLMEPPGISLIRVFFFLKNHQIENLAPQLHNIVL